MTAGAPRGRAVPYVALGACLGIGAVSLMSAARGSNTVQDGQSTPVWLGLSAVVYLGLGGLLVVRRPRLVLPWLLVAFGVCLSLTTVAAAYEVDASNALARLGGILYMSFAILTALIVQLFPTGKPLSGGWRWITRALLAGGGLVVLGQAVGVDLDHDPVLWLRIVGLVVVSTFAAGMLGSLPMLVVRFRRAQGAERAQLKWFLLSIAFLVVGWFAPDEFLGTPYRSVTNVASLLPAVAIALALLRYRLYDIDRIISRTASYAAVTGLVLATYAVVVTLVLRLLPESSGLAVASATLTAAAVARPAVRRVQGLVDRRFDRTRFDQVRTVETFGDRMQALVSPDDVTDELLRTVRGTLQPASSALWSVEMGRG